MNNVTKIFNTLTDNVKEKLTQGLLNLCKDTNERPFTFSATFLAYKLRLDPLVVADHLEEIVSDSVASYNQAKQGTTPQEIASYKIDTPDILITLDCRSR